MDSQSLKGLRRSSRDFSPPEMRISIGHRGSAKETRVSKTQREASTKAAGPGLFSFQDFALPCKQWPYYNLPPPAFLQLLNMQPMLRRMGIYSSVKAPKGAMGSGG